MYVDATLFWLMALRAACTRVDYELTLGAILCRMPLSTDDVYRIIRANASGPEKFRLLALAGDKDKQGYRWEGLHEDEILGVLRKHLATAECTSAGEIVAAAP